ncbi:hypothetical protein ACFLVX_05480 [Chloroflexota bacterium]
MKLFQRIKKRGINAIAPTKTVSKIRTSLLVSKRCGNLSLLKMAARRILSLLKLNKAP